jgi:integrase/recombinase XerD
LHVKGIRKTLPSGIFDYPVPEDLYQNYPGKILREKRNRVILGLLIYQGVTTGELHRLDVADIKLKQGKIRIPGSRKSGSRVLGLKPFQIPEMH